MANKLAFAAVLILLAGMASAGYTATERTGVIINTASWQEAITASTFASANDLAFKYVQGNEENKYVMSDVYTLQITKALLYEQKSNPLPTLALSIRSMGISIDQFGYGERDELAEQLLQIQRPSEVILVRDDFALDAISSIYLARTGRDMILFSQGNGAPSARLVKAMRDSGVRKIIAVGNLKPEAFDALNVFTVEKVAGRDDYETSQVVNEYAFTRKPPASQAIITTGDVIEDTVLQPNNAPVFAVPEISVYSLPRTAQIFQSNNISFAIGVGNTVSGPSEWFKQRIDHFRVIIKMSRLRPPDDGSAFVRKDLLNALPGYHPPVPTYEFHIESVAPAYADIMGLDTGRAVFLDAADKITKNRPAPQVTMRATVNNSGNIDAPITVFFRVSDPANNTVVSLTSEKLLIAPGQRKVFTAVWADAPGEGQYNVEARAFADVYEGLSTASNATPFGLLWQTVWINLLLLVCLIMITCAIAYYSFKLHRTERETNTVAGRLADQADEVSQKVSGRLRKQK